MTWQANTELATCGNKCHHSAKKGDAKSLVSKMICKAYLTIKAIASCVRV